MGDQLVFIHYFSFVYISITLVLAGIMSVLGGAYASA